MKTLLIEAPINHLSFGNVSYNILRELSKTDIDVGLFATGNIDISAFNIDPEFKKWLEAAINNRWAILKLKPQSLKLWHLNGGENRKSNNQNLLTFYECSSPTVAEISVAKSQDKVLFSSTYSQNLFKNHGCENTMFVPMGFDADFHITGKEYLNDVVHFGLMGKFEKRKHTANIIKTWLKAFGNNNKFQLTCCVTNPFFKPEHMQALIQDALGGKRYTNINFLPYLKTNTEVNELMNAVDVDLTGLSGGEGWNLPAFNSTCLGKWSVVLNATSHKDWANEENCILVEPNGTMPVSDGFFFSDHGEYNRGEFFTWDEAVVISAMEKAASKAKTKNTKGIELGRVLSYKNTTDLIIKSFD